MWKDKQIYTIHSYQFYTPILVLIFFPVIVLIDAICYRDIQFFYPFLWITPLVCLPGMILGSVRKVIIDTRMKSVTIYEWFGETVVIPQGTLRSATLQKSITQLVFQKEDNLIKYNFYSWIYRLYGLKKIMNSLREFNPDASFGGFEKY